MHKHNDPKKTKFPTVQEPIAVWNVKAQTNEKQTILPAATRGTLPNAQNDLPEKILNNSQVNNKLSNFI